MKLKFIRDKTFVTKMREMRPIGSEIFTFFICRIKKQIGPNGGFLQKFYNDSHCFMKGYICEKKIK